jgi:hypothetical protein
MAKSEFKKLSFVPVKTSKVLYRNAEKIISDIDFHPKGQHFFCFLAGEFVYGDFIEALFEKTQFKTDELIISTLSLSSVNIQSLKNLLEGGYVKKLTLVLSAYFYANERQKLIKDLSVLPNTRIFIAYVHVKMVLFKTDEGHNYVMSGSANLRSSQNIEQLDIIDSKEMYDYSANFIKNAVKYHKVRLGVKVNDDCFNIDDLEAFDFDDLSGFKMEF